MRRALSLLVLLGLLAGPGLVLDAQRHPAGADVLDPAGPLEPGVLEPGTPDSGVDAGTDSGTSLLDGNLADDGMPLGFLDGGAGSGAGAGALALGLGGLDGLAGALIPSDARAAVSDDYLQATQLMEQQALAQDALEAARRARQQAELKRLEQLRAAGMGAKLPASVPFAQAFNDAGQQYGVDPRLLAAVARAESGLAEPTARCAGVVGVTPMGLFQMTPAVAGSYGANPCDPAGAAAAAAQILVGLQGRYGSWDLAIAAFHGGTAAIDAARAVPAELAGYVAQVNGFWAEYKRLAPEASAKAAQAVELAVSKLGTPYVFGAGRSENPTNFDCSGLTWWAYHKVGITLGTWTMTQKDDGVRIASYHEFDGPVPYSALVERARPGDLILLKGGDGRYSDGYPGHVGMYIGDGKMVHAPRTGDVVKISPLSSRSDIMYIQRVATA